MTTLLHRAESNSLRRRMRADPSSASMSIPAGHAIKVATPDFRIATDEREFKDLGMGQFLGDLLH